MCVVLALMGCAFSTFIAPACKQEKAGVEKLAEDLARSASASRVVDAAPDPAEIKYRERKKQLEQRVTDLKADEARLMAGDAGAKPGMLRGYFSRGGDGEKSARELEAKRKKDGAEGYRIKKVKIVSSNVRGTMEDADIEVQEETIAKGTSGCLLYTQTWKHDGETWVVETQKSVKKVDCD